MTHPAAGADPAGPAPADLSAGSSVGGSGQRGVRTVLVLAGAAAGGYGLFLLRPQLGATAWWLLAGPVLHDVLVAPLVGLVGLALTRLARGPAARRWLRGGLVVTGTLLLIAVPLVWRPAAAPPNPGLQDRDYPRGLAVWLLALWLGVAAAALLSRRRPRRPRTPPDDHEAGGRDTPGNGRPTS
ncbi:hypothetical protein ACFFWC_01155 [Plantactinospora siamensis]|uniref:Uncharacterized protein n=1 Tax=Plantactinospora siamensis TaxID=555372 RepID=A0ABV6NVE1_9ACTN